RPVRFFNIRSDNATSNYAPDPRPPLKLLKSLVPPGAAMSQAAFEDATTLCHAGNDPAAHHGIINPPVYHASTVLFPSMADLEGALHDRFSDISYGRYGTPTTFAFEQAVATLEGGDKAVAFPSGLAAITVALLSFLRSGDHALVVDSVYDPVRSLC